MSTTTGIEWTDATWNPIRGCSRVSEGCRNCYAEKVAYRFSGPGRPYEGLMQIRTTPTVSATLPDRLPLWNGKIKFVEEHLLDPLKWRAPRRIFVNSMSDLFHENVTDEMLDRIFAVMFSTPRHTYQCLTKRPGRMREYFNDDNPRYTARKIADAAWEMRIHGHVFDCDLYFPLMNVWLGVSVENQKAADERIPLLLQTPAAVRFLSVEPLLGPIDFGPQCPAPKTCTGECGWASPYRLLGDQYGNFIDWVIVGGESGPGARPMHPDWARGLRDQCVAAGVHFFFKQWGEWLPLTDYDPFVLGKDADKFKHEFAWRVGAKNDAELPISCYRVGKKAAGHLLDGAEWHQFPEAQ